MSNENKVTLQLPRIKGWEFIKVAPITPGCHYLPLEIAVAIVDRHGDIEHHAPVLYTAYKADNNSWVALYEPQKVLQPSTMVWYPEEDYHLVPTGAWVIAKTHRDTMLQDAMTHVFVKVGAKRSLPYGNRFAILKLPNTKGDNK